jgi:hypothetical protein
MIINVTSPIIIVKFSNFMYYVNFLILSLFLGLGWVFSFFFMIHNLKIIIYNQDNVVKALMKVLTSHWDYMLIKNTVHV